MVDKRVASVEELSPVAAGDHVINVEDVVTVMIVKAGGEHGTKSSHEERHPATSEDREHVL